MKKFIYLTLVAIVLMAASTPEITSDTPVKGAWKVVRSQYGDEPMGERSPEDRTYKLFTGTR